MVTDLDIFERVGRGVAHDEYVPFRVQDGKLIYNDEESDILAGKIRVEFIKVITLSVRRIEIKFGTCMYIILLFINFEIARQIS